MKTKALSVMAAAAVSLSLTSGANAGSLAECLSTDIAVFDGNIVEAAIATPALSTLVDAVLAAGLEDALATAEDITVYAPTNDAFAAIPGDILNTIVGDTGLLTAVLTYHVTPGMQDPRKFVPPVRRTTLQGDNVYYSRTDGQPRVNNAAVDCQGVQADNGIVWIIDSVLLPSL
jgi:uncharacterized surface protein with fasciclin (FAS1) repeats